MSVRLPQWVLGSQVLQQTSSIAKKVVSMRENAVSCFLVISNNVIEIYYTKRTQSGS